MTGLDRRLRLNLFLLICCLGFIWGNSLLPGGLSQALSDWCKWVLTPSASPAPEYESSGLLRKLAHLAEFAALGMLLSWRLTMLKKKAGAAFLWGAAAACVDETIQVFVPDRGPGIRDVILDSCGVAAGMLLFYLGYTYYTKKIQTNLEDK